MSIITKLLTTITHKRNTYRLGFVLTWQKESGWTLRPREKESLPFLIIYNSEEEGERIGVGWFWGLGHGRAGHAEAAHRSASGALGTLRLSSFFSCSSFSFTFSSSSSTSSSSTSASSSSSSLSISPTPTTTTTTTTPQVLFYLSRSLWAFWLVCTLHRNRFWFHFPVFPILLEVLSSFCLGILVSLISVFYFHFLC